MKSPQAAPAHQAYFLRACEDSVTAHELTRSLWRYRCRKFRRAATLAGISVCCSGCRECRRVATAIGNFAVFLRLSKISLRRCVATAVRHFAVLLRLLGNSRGAKLSGNPPCWCYGCQEFHCAASVVGNFAVSLLLSGNWRAVLLPFSRISSCCYGCRELRRVDTAVGNFTVLLRLSGISP